MDSVNTFIMLACVFCFILFVWFSLWFFETGSFCTAVAVWTHCVGQAGFKLTAIHLPLYPRVLGLQVCDIALGSLCLFIGELSPLLMRDINGQWLFNLVWWWWWWWLWWWERENVCNLKNMECFTKLLFVLAQWWC